MKRYINILFLISGCILISVQSSAQGSKNYKDFQDALRKPDNVEWLTLHDQHLINFQEDILKLKNLKYPDLSNNRITRLPENLCSLKNLFYLDLSGNQLECLPASLGGIQTRRNLYLDYNNPHNLASLKY